MGSVSSSSTHCSSVLHRIKNEGVTREIVLYLIQAIKAPCGFLTNDFTLCCAGIPDPDDFTTNTTSTTTSTTTTSTITTNTNTTTTITTPTVAPKCGVAPLVTQVAPSAQFNVNQPRRTISRYGTWNKIVGGSQSTYGSWPWAVLLGKKFSDGHFQVICGGTLISTQYVLTAAHCFHSGDPSTWANTVRVGETDINISGEAGGHQDLAIKTVRNHQGWNPDTLANDISLLKLASAVEVRPAVVPVCLPSIHQGLNLTSSLSSQSPTIVGWGATMVGGSTVSRLREATVPVVGDQQCSSIYQEIGVTVGPGQLCAGNGTADTCQGDSGGGMLSKNQGEDGWTVVGVTSFGVDCARPDFPGVYTRVDTYLDWIHQHTI